VVSNYGKTRNSLLLVNSAVGVTTTTKPVVAPLGMLAFRYVLDFKVKVAGIPLNDTVELAVKP